jgi:SAM-dependent methyltransferase
MNMEYVPAGCRVCGHSQAKYLFQVDAHNLLECVNCGFRFPDFIPPPQLLGAHYDSEYRDERFVRGQRVNASINQRILAKTIGNLRFSNVLDVGAGYGFFASALNQMFSVTCEAVEISGVQRTFAQEVLGLTVYSDLESISKTYDLVTCFEVIEHVPDPPVFLAALSRLLNPSGILVLGTDNFDSPTVHSMEMAFPKWVPHEHISCFTPTSIQWLFSGEPTLSLLSLRTYCSWELRLSSFLHASNRFFPNRDCRKKNLLIEPQINTTSSSSSAPQRAYKLYKVRKLLTPIFASQTLSSSLEGEMMIIHAVRSPARKS